MLNFIATILVSAVATFATAVGIYNYLPVGYLEFSQPEPRLGSTITTINATDLISASRATINTNFSNLNTDKAEIASANAFTGANTFSALQTFTNASTSLSSCYGTCYFGATATSSFSRAGALTLITPLSVASGGTGSTTLAINQVLLGSTTNAVGVVAGTGTTGQFLTSNGAGQPPTWQTSAVDTAIAYTWTGNHSFTASTTFSSATTTFGGGVTFNKIVDGNISRMIIATTTNVSFNNTTASTTLFLATIPANTLYNGYNGLVKTRLNISDFGIGTNERFQIEVKYGGTSVCCTATSTSAASAYQFSGATGYIDIDLYGNNATNAQEIFIQPMLSGVAVNAAGSTFPLFMLGKTGATAIDSTAAQTLEVIASFPVSALTANTLTISQVNSFLQR